MAVEERDSLRRERDRLSAEVKRQDKDDAEFLPRDKRALARLERRVAHLEWRRWVDEEKELLAACTGLAAAVEEYWVAGREISVEAESTMVPNLRFERIEDEPVSETPATLEERLALEPRVKMEVGEDGVELSPLTSSYNDNKRLYEENEEEENSAKLWSLMNDARGNW